MAWNDGKYPCKHGCGARFRRRISLLEHEAIPHVQCPTCKRWYRTLDAHYEKAKNNRGHYKWACGPKGKRRNGKA
jgi:hypothetical protein